jgi:serine/threonine protein kinase
MAEIFLARGMTVAGIERHVVLKRILSQHASRPELVAMFLDEARLAAQLQHPNVAQVYDIGRLDDAYFFTMEYVHGETVRALLVRCSELGRAVPLGCVLGVIAGAAAGLHHAHERKGVDGRPLGIVHRDVSLSNLMISFEGAVKVVDFGIAKAANRLVDTLSGQIKGKIGYLSPEQCRSQPVDRRSDVFSLGIVMWELLARERLFERGSDFETMAAIVQEDITPPSSVRADVPPAIDAIVMKMLARSVDQRYQTAGEVLHDIERAAVAVGAVLSASTLGMLLRELFGERPEPWLELPAAAASPLTDDPALGATTTPQPHLDPSSLDDAVELADTLPSSGRQMRAEVGEPPTHREPRHTPTTAPVVPPAANDQPQPAVDRSQFDTVRLPRLEVVLPPLAPVALPATSSPPAVPLPAPAHDPTPRPQATPVSALPHMASSPHQLAGQALAGRRFRPHTVAGKRRLPWLAIVGGGALLLVIVLAFALSGSERDHTSGAVHVVVAPPALSPPPQPLAAPSPEPSLVAPSSPSMGPSSPPASTPPEALPPSAAPPSSQEPDPQPPQSSLSSKAAPASRPPTSKPAVEPTAEELVEWFQHSHYHDIARACAQAKVAEKAAVTCTLAACKVGDAANAAKWFALASADRRQDLATACLGSSIKLEPTTDELVEWFQHSRYRDIARACANPELATRAAPVCTLAACKLGDSASAARWFALAPNDKRQALITSCLVSRVQLPAAASVPASAPPTSSSTHAVERTANDRLELFQQSR